MASISRILELAPTCCYLANNSKDKKALFGGVPKSLQNQATLIYIYWKILNTIYELDNDYDGLYAPAQYLFELEQKFAFKAANIVDGGGGGQIAPITPTTLPSPYYFIVSASSFIATGASSKTIDAFIGYNLIFTRGGVPQSTVTTESSYFTWDSDTGEFTCSPVLYEDELIGLIPV